MQVGKSILTAAVFAAGLTATALAQQDHGQHHSAGGGAPRAARSPQAQPAGGSGTTPAQIGTAAAQSDAMKGYMAAMDAMHGPMMQAAQEADPDVAFGKGMIPHHQGAIDMARIVLQHGKDEQVKTWAADVIREQQREIDAMQKWLKAKSK
jgi:uncharacterized protein (DUF305 family)